MKIDLDDLGFIKTSNNVYKKKINQESTITVILDNLILVESKRFKCYSYELTIEKVNQLIKIFNI